MKTYQWIGLGAILLILVSTGAPFVCASQDVLSKEDQKNVQPDLQKLLLLPREFQQTHATGLPRSWGPIFSATCTTEKKLRYMNTSLSVPTFTYRVVGFGDHKIEYNLSYHFLLGNGVWENRSYQGLDTLYVIINPLSFFYFLYMNMTPIKIIGKDSIEFPQEDLHYGNWTITLTVDDEIRDTSTFIFDPLGCLI